MKNTKVLLVIISIAILFCTLYIVYEDNDIPASPMNSHNGYPY
jgi:hypothetical protein